MRRLTLREYCPELAVPLTIEQRDQLAKVVAVRPTAGRDDLFDLTPGSTIGALRLDGLDVIIKPKVPMDRVFFMLSYAMGRISELGIGPESEYAEDLVEAIVEGFIRHVRRALARGVQQGYRTVDESALTLRGRLRVGDQIRRRFGPAPPAEITYDDFSVDIEMNRLLRAAADRLSRLRLRSLRSRASLRAIEARLDGVTLVTYDPRNLPAVAFNRLNERYRDAVTLARFILLSTSFDLGHGLVPASSFLVDMNRVFEDFVVVALREALGQIDGEFVQGSARHPLYLDEERTIKLQPDLSLWQAGRCAWIGDAKYKRVAPNDYPNADLYQVTAYAIATGLDRATLIYAKSEGPATTHRIVHLGKTIEAIALDLSAPSALLLEQIDEIANRIRSSATLLQGIA
jgi:5-methylcytosine-specific restriction enzyme subunit McrC